MYALFNFPPKSPSVKSMSVEWFAVIVSYVQKLIKTCFESRLVVCKKICIPVFYILFGFL